MLWREPRSRKHIRLNLSNPCPMRPILIIWTASSPTLSSNLCRNSFRDRIINRFHYSSLLGEERSKHKRMGKIASCNVIWLKWWPRTSTTSRKTTSSQSQMRPWYSSPFSSNTTNSMASNRTISTNMVNLKWTISTVLEELTPWINSK